MAVKWKDWNGVTLGFSAARHNTTKQTPFSTTWGKAEANKAFERYAL